MKIKVLNKTKDEIEIEIEGEEETILPGLRRKLLEDERVLHANYTIVHPMLDYPKFYVKVLDGKPQNALKRAAKQLASEYGDLEKQFKRQLKDFEKG